MTPDDPHAGTALVGGRCPICGWTLIDRTTNPRTTDPK